MLERDWSAIYRRVKSSRTVKGYQLTEMVEEK